MEKYYERPNYRTTDDLLSRYVVIFPGCATTAALKATLGKGATERWTIGSSDGNQPMLGIRIAIVYHSGYGHTRRQAEAVNCGVEQVEGPKPCCSVSTRRKGVVMSAASSPHPPNFRMATGQTGQPDTRPIR
jgi:hypothetical protein